MVSFPLAISLVQNLLECELRPALLVTNSPFYVEKKSILKLGIFRSIAGFLKFTFVFLFRKNKYGIYFLAKRNSIKVFPAQLVNTDRCEHSIKKLNPDFIFVFAFPILKEKIFKIPKYGTINCHPSLLPQNKGATPWNWQFHVDGQMSGITFHYITKKIDGGPIIDQYKIPLSGFENSTVLREYLFSLIARLYVRLIYKFFLGEIGVFNKSLKNESSYFRPFSMSDSIISPDENQESLELKIKAAGVATFKIFGNEYKIIDNIRLQNFGPDKCPYELNGDIVYKTVDGKVNLLIAQK